MDDLVQDTDEAGQAEESHPLIETVTAAFRKTTEGRGEKTESDRPSATEPVREMPSAPTWSPAEVVEETITAFRKAARRTVKRRAEKRRDEERPETRSTEEPSRNEPGKANAEEEGEERADEPKTCSPEDLAPEFRRALSERGRAAEKETSSEETPAMEEASSNLPLPDSSFLWVTDSPTAPSAAISVEDLSEPRAQEAEAFLLQGDGTQPYQLLKRIRRHPEANVYLKPVFWRRAPGQQSPVAAHVDGTWTPDTDRDALSALRKHATTINRRIRDLAEKGGVEEGGVERRVLRFVATRDEEFSPRRTEEPGVEFVYPKLSPLLDGPSRREGARGGEGDELAQILWMTARRIRKK